MLEKQSNNKTDYDKSMHPAHCFCNTKLKL